NNIVHRLIGPIYEDLSVEEKYKIIKNTCKISNTDEFIVRLSNQYKTMVDEATSALDSQSKKIVQDMLNKAFKNRTTIIVTHRLSTIYNTKKIIVINEGAVIKYENIALVSQEPSLYDMTIRKNMIFGYQSGQQATQEDVENACLPDGYDTYIGGKGMQPLDSQKQRIAIARALIQNPRILLLDKATSALDFGSEIAIQKALDTATTGRTTLAIIYRLSTIQHVDVIFVIKDSK
ncbi:4588_t:CDS:2, partial [Racocetra persica]